MRFERKHLSVALLSIGILIVALLCGQKRLPEHLLVVDMRRVVQMPAASLARSKLSSARQNELMSRYTALLPRVIQAYSKTHRATIVSAQVLASQNDLDITDAIIAETIRRLKHES